MTCRERTAISAPQSRHLSAVAARPLFNRARLSAIFLRHRGERLAGCNPPSNLTLLPPAFAPFERRTLRLVSPRRLPSRTPRPLLHLPHGAPDPCGIARWATAQEGNARWMNVGKSGCEVAFAGVLDNAGDAPKTFPRPLPNDKVRPEGDLQVEPEERGGFSGR